MLPNRTAIAFCALLLCGALALPSAADAALVTHFNFNGYDGNSTTINADSGSGVAALAGWTAGDLNVNADGTDINAAESVMASDNNAIELGNVNGSSVTIDVNTLGHSGLQLSFAGKGPNSTFGDVDIAYSINGGGFTNIDPSAIVDPSDPNTYAVTSFNLSSITALNNQSAVALRLTFNESTGGGTQLLMDNLRIDAAAAVPEPASLALMGLAGLAFAGAGYRSRRGRRRSGQASPDLSRAG